MKIKVLAMDVDGTLTDGKIYMGNCGEFVKAFYIKDGYAIKHILPQYNIIPVIITGRESQIVLNRCKELNIQYCFQDCAVKINQLHKIAANFNITVDAEGVYREIAYIGDDSNDLECMKKCGYVGCPADAVPQVRKIADFISGKNGGDGAVREFIENIISVG